MLMAEQLSLMRQSIDQYCHPVPSLESEPSRVTTTRQLVAQGIKNILDHFDIFQACLTPDTPFMQHFVRCLNGYVDDDTGAEQILEDIVIFFREKSLRLPAPQITPTERRILTYFEQSYHPDPESLVVRWYWFYLPCIISKEFGKEVHLTDELIQALKSPHIPC